MVPKGISPCNIEFENFRQASKKRAAFAYELSICAAKRYKFEFKSDRILFD
jgi:hypothetical protein